MDMLHGVMGGIVAGGSSVELLASSLTTSASFSHTIAAGTDLLVCFTSVWGGGSPTVSAVTFNGSSLTEETGARSYGTQEARTQLWWIAAPATGSNTLAITHSASAGRCAAGLYNLSGAHQTTPFAEVNGNETNAGTTVQTSITAGAANGILLACTANRDSATSITLDTDTVDDSQITQPATAIGHTIIDSIGVKTVTGTSAGADDLALSIGRVQPA